MSTDDLNAPLGLDRKPARFRAALLATRVSAGLLGAVLALFAAWVLFGDDPLGGEPTAVVNAGLSGTGTNDGQAKPGLGGAGSEQAALPRVVKGGDGPPGVAADKAPGQPGPNNGPLVSPARDAAPAGPGEQIVTIIDGKSGARQEVRIPAAATAAVPQGSDQLSEMTRNGPIPRIGADGLRAAQAYAQPAAARNDWPQIAIVLTGLGISATAVTQALSNLPGPVTFAFAPYGGDLERIAANVRSLGHELLLQVPMEPFDYPDNDPGPQTLLTGLAPEQNIDRLQWAMSRFQGYVGIINMMGARFTASEMSFVPVLREIGKRGLIYVDDGTSPRSLANQIAGGNSLPFAKSSVLLDAVPSAGEIDRALARLEATARNEGIAVGVATALPVSIERIARWAKTLGARGFALVPITAAVRPKST